jgi:adenylate cyclase
MIEAPDLHVGAVEQEFGDELSVGVGLNSGTVVAGNVGGSRPAGVRRHRRRGQRRARVEAATRQTGDKALISERTRELLRDPEVPLEERSQMTLKGKREPVTLYAPRITTPSGVLRRRHAEGEATV